MDCDGSWGCLPSCLPDQWQSLSHLLTHTVPVQGIMALA